VATVHWTIGARLDVDDLKLSFARTSPVFAAALINRLVEAADGLEVFPAMGRVVPEYADQSIRELIVGAYRLVYVYDGQREWVGLAAVSHSSRDLLRHLGPNPWNAIRDEDI